MEKLSLKIPRNSGTLCLLRAIKMLSRTCSMQVRLNENGDNGNEWTKV